MLNLLVANLLNPVAPVLRTRDNPAAQKGDPRWLAAKAEHLRTYEGNPCGHCGKTLRYTCNRACVACQLANSRQRHHPKESRA